MSGKWLQIIAKNAAAAAKNASSSSSRPLPRSSHGVSVVGDVLWVYGGETVARTPLPYSQQMFALNLSDKAVTVGSSSSSPIELAPRVWHNVAVPKDGSPLPRVAHAQCVVSGASAAAAAGAAGAAAGAEGDERIVVFGGRRGVDMKEEALNDLWMFSPRTLQWTQIHAGGDAPEARS